MLQVKRVLVPVDFSEPALAAANYAAALCQSQGAALRLLHIVDVRPISLYGMSPMWDASGFEQGLRDSAKEQMDQLIAQLDTKKAPGVQVTSQIDATSESIAHSICEEALRSQCDLIIIPTHGRTGLNRLLIGSVAEQVVRQAPCPTLVLPGKKTTK